MRASTYCGRLSAKPQPIRNRSSRTLRAVAYDEQLADRVRGVLAFRDSVSERKMFGGLAFMLAGNMACGIIGGELMVRLSPEDAERALREPGVRPMDFTGRPMKGIVYISPEAIATDAALAAWVDEAAVHAASMPPK
jgi:TfoX/Sxy family transcriptional regulator of competence genes